MRLHHPGGPSHSNMYYCAFGCFHRCEFRYPEEHKKSILKKRNEWKVARGDKRQKLLSFSKPTPPFPPTLLLYEIEYRYKIEILLELKF